MITPSRPHGHIPGRDYTTAIRGAVLDDRRIAHYIRLGFYGEAARQRLLDSETVAVPKPRPAKPLGALDLLKSFLP